MKKWSPITNCCCCGKATPKSAAANRRGMCRECYQARKSKDARLRKIHRKRHTLSMHRKANERVCLYTDDPNEVGTMIEWRGCVPDIGRMS